MASRHAAILAAEPKVAPAIICSSQRSLGKAEEFQARYGFQQRTADFESVIADDSIDIVYVCSPDPTHPTFTAQALRAGKHVFCEKPLARNPRGLEMVSTARLENPKPILQIGMNCRYREQYSIPKQYLDSGELGPLRFIRGNYLLNKVASVKRREKEWWLDHPPEIEFFLHANGVHILDLMRWLGGPVESVFARSSGFELGEDFKSDTFSISLGFQSGALGEVLISSAAFHPRDVSLSIWCQNGSVVGTDLYRRRGEEVDAVPEKIEVVQKTLDLGLQLRDLLTAIETGEQPMNSFQEARENFWLIQAIERSIQEKRAVLLENRFENSR